MTSEVERVALAALTYRELWCNYSVVGPRRDGSEIVDDLEAERSDISLLTMFGSRAMSELDWVIIRALDRPDVLGSLFKEIEPWRAEAVLHAVAAGEPTWGQAFLGYWMSLSVAARWAEVESAMELWRELGVTATHDEVETHVAARERVA
jgi:hypothetical protein